MRSLSTLFSANCGQAVCFWQVFAKVTVITLLMMAFVNTPERLRLTLLVITCSLGFEGVKQGWLHLMFHPGQQNYQRCRVSGRQQRRRRWDADARGLLLALFQTTLKICSRRCTDSCWSAWSFDP